MQINIRWTFFAYNAKDKRPDGNYDFDAISKVEIDDAKTEKEALKIAKGLIKRTNYALEKVSKWKSVEQTDIQNKSIALMEKLIKKIN